jgi:hypothetical protein
MIRPPGIDNGPFVVLPEKVWYARVLLLFSASAKTDSASKFFDCALVSTMETYDDPENGCYMYYMYYIHYTYSMYYMYDMHDMCYTYYMYFVYYIHYLVFAGSLNSIGSQILYELDHRKPVLYVIPVEYILGNLHLCGDTGTIQRHLHNLFPGAPGDSRQGAGDGCRMWFVNSWAMAWSRDYGVTCNEWEVEFGPCQPPCTVLIE